MSDSQTINNIVKRRALQSPGEAGFFYRRTSGEWVAVTWRSFQDQVSRLAAALASKGLRKGDRVAIIAHTCFKWELADKASLLCGAVVVGIDPALSVDHITESLKQAEIQVAFVDNEAIFDKLPADVREPLRIAVAFEWGATTEQPTGLSLWDRLLEESQHADFAPPSVQPEDLALLVFTSGTTGFPKGIPYTHGQLVLACQATQSTLAQFEPGGRLICWLPLANLFQRFVNLIGAMTGQQTYIWEDPKTIGEAIRTIRPTFLIGVPRFYEKVRQAILGDLASQPPLKKTIAGWALSVGRRMSFAVQEKKAAPLSLRLALLAAKSLVLNRIRNQVFGSEIRYCITGSAPIHPDVLVFFHSLGVLILEAYALSENIIPMAINRMDDFRFGSVGKPVAPNEIRISPDGSVRVRGAGVCRGYWKSETTDMPRDQEGFLITGDLGRFDPDGFLFLTGRESEVIKTSTGRRISLAWVESVLRRSVLFDQVVLIGQARPFLVALFAINGRAFEPSRLSDEIHTRIQQEIDQMNDTLAPYERPRAFAILNAPLSVERGELTPSLKIKRQVVERHYHDVIEQLYRSPGNPA